MVATNSHWTVYIISCHDGSLYTGITNNLTRRFQEHQTQHPKRAKYLRGKTALQVVFSQVVKNQSEALKMEYQIKKLSKQKKLQLIAQGGWPEENI